MKKAHLRLAACISLSAVVSLMTACHRTPSDSSNPNMSSHDAECASNPYLMKYGCSIERIQSAAERGNPDAQYALGYMYYYGIDTVKDKDTAELWIQRAAEQGQPLAKKAWELINTGATFDNLHQAAKKAATVPSNTIYPQEPTDVNKMNVKTSAPTSVNHELPAYGKTQQQSNAKTMTTGQVTDRLHDQRLASNAKPVIGVKEKPSVSDEKLALNQKPMPHPYEKPIALNNKPVIAQAEKSEKTETAGKIEQVAKQEGGYTLQLLGSANAKDIKNYITAHNLGDRAHFYRTEYEGRAWYMLTYGNYHSPQEARMALQSLPQDLKHHQPWVKSVATIEKEVTLQKVVV